MKRLKSQGKEHLIKREGKKQGLLMQMDVLHFNNPNLLIHFCNFVCSHVSESLTDIGRQTSVSISHRSAVEEHSIAFIWPDQRLY